MAPGNTDPAPFVDQRIKSYQVARHTKRGAELGKSVGRKPLTNRKGKLNVPRSFRSALRWNHDSGQHRPDNIRFCVFRLVHCLHRGKPDPVVLDGILPCRRGFQMARGQERMRV